MKTPVLLGSALAIFLLPLANAAEAELSLVLGGAATENNLTVQVVALGFPDTDTAKVSGDLGVKLVVDPSDGSVSGLEFNGGRLQVSNLDFTLALGAATASLTDLSGFPDTPSPLGAVNPANGEFPAENHTITFDQGVISGNAPGTSLSQNFAEEPATSTAAGVGQLSLQELSRTTTKINYQVSIELPLNDTQTFTENGISVDVTFTGTLTATGTVAVFRSPYLQWTEEQGISGVAFDSPFAPGAWANGLVWAMRSEGVSWLPQAGGGWQLPLPSEGTRGLLLIEQSDSLSSWIPAEPSQVAGGVVELPISSTGAITILPQSTAKFFRIRALAPYTNSQK